YFAIDVSTPEGLETLKHWMYDHLEGASDGSIVNFAAGINNTGYDMVSGKIVSWGSPVNHAMTFVGWDDNISYDFSGDGTITNDVDINNDGVVDMKDWERGALIMVNSWGTYWGNGGKAYVMYKLLAEPVENGGIHANKVYGIHVKETQSPQLIIKIKMTHSSRQLIKISAGVSANISDTEPEHILNFPLFSKQGGEYPMNGSNSNTVEIALDVSSLLTYVNSGENGKFFLKITEDDIYSGGSGQIYDFSIKDNLGNEYVCLSHNVAINDNSETYLSVTAAAEFDAPEISTETLPYGQQGSSYSYQLEATGGTEPYMWNVSQKYTENSLSETYPNISASQLSPTDDDDGYATQTIDFNFPYYGELYNELYISTDGSVLFEPGFNYLRTEEAIIGNKIIGVFASDLMIYPADADGIFYEGDSNHATFRWKTSLFGNQSANVDVAVTLYPSGEIKFYYGDNITPGLTWASGISNGSGSYVISSVSGMSDPSNNQLSMIGEPFPAGMTITDSGIFTGTVPNEDNSWDIDFLVTDNNNISKIKTLIFTTVPASIKDIDYFNLKCYPNPIRKAVTINFEIDKPANVNFSIYDISGRLIETLINGKQENGEYHIVWTPKVSAGTYFYKLTSDLNVMSGKLIIQ
ncbi:MAG: hypothetical protein DRI94_03970, partial [Bacteroidetes bacterium]